MARIYAAVTDLPTDLQAKPRAADLIPLASDMVTRAISGAIFPVDVVGMPTGDALDAAHRATIAQVSTWLSTGVDPIVGRSAKTRVTASKSTNGSSISYQADLARDAEMDALASGSALTDGAMLILDAAGLLGIQVNHPRPWRMYHPVPSPDTLIDGGEG